MVKEEKDWEKEVPSVTERFCVITSRVLPMVRSETSDNTHPGTGQLGRDKFKISRPGTLDSVTIISAVLCIFM